MTGAQPVTDETLIAFAAGELPEAEAAQLVGRLAAEPALQARLDDWARQDAAIRALYAPTGAEPVPGRLLAVVERARAAPPARRWGWPLQIAAALALLGLGATGGWVAHGPAPRPAALTLAREVAEAHQTFAVEVRHPVEVQASDAAHLTTWLSKRLGHPIHAPDFAALGFSLMGGRILPAATGTAALFMYEDAAGQRITLYVAPEGSADTTAFRFFEDDGVQGFFWLDGDLSYAVAGTLPREVLRKVATAAYDQLL